MIFDRPELPSWQIRVSVVSPKLERDSAFRRAMVVQISLKIVRV